MNTLKSPSVKTLVVSLIFGLTGIYTGLQLASIFYSLAASHDPGFLIVSKTLYQEMVRESEDPMRVFGFWGLFMIQKPGLFAVISLFVIQIFSFLLLMWLANRDCKQAFKVNRYTSVLAWVIGFYGFYVYLGSDFVAINMFEGPLWRIILLPILVGLLFIIIGEGGWVSIIAKKERGLATAFLRGFLSGIILLVVSATYNRYGDYVFKIILNRWVIGEAGVETRLGFQRINACLSVSYGLSFAIIGGVLMAMFNRRISQIQRLLSLALPILLLAVGLYLGESFISHAKANWDMDKQSLNEAALLTVLPEGPISRMALVLKDAEVTEGEEVPLKKPILFSSLKNDTISSEIGMVPENIPKIEQYLKERKGRPTYFTGSAMEARREIPARNWMVKEFREASLKNVIENDSVINSMKLMMSLKIAPATPDNREILTTLSDETNFYISGRASLQLAKAWAAFGELEIAQEWFKRAKAELTPDNLGNWSVPIEPGFSRGRISGRIIGAVTTGARVGLVRLGKDEQAAHFFIPHIVSATDLRQDGNFTFESLQGGRFYAAILLAPGQKGPFKITGGGFIELSKENPAVDLGEIRIERLKQRTLN